MAKFVESRRIWDKGDWGNLGAYRAGMAEDGFFKAENMLVYDNGSVGPRTGLTAMGYTGVPTGVIQLFGYVAAGKGGFSGLILIVVGDKAYWAPALAPGEAFTQIPGTLAAAETSYCSAASIVVDGDVTYFATRTQGVYKWDMTADTLTQVFSQTGIYDMVRYRDRLYVSTKMRIFYSDAADFDTWDAALQFFDVGWQYPIYRMASLRNNLYLLTQGGEHYVASGVPESTLTLRAAGEGLAPDMHSAISVPSVDSVWWVPQFRNGPVKFRGGIFDTKSLEHLDDWTTSDSGERSGAFSFGAEATLFLGADAGALFNHNDAWTRHTFNAAVKYTTRVGSDWFGFCDGGTSTTAATFHLWTYAYDQPGAVGVSLRRPGDASDTPVAAYLYVPEWWHPQGQDVRAETVEVEFTSFDTSTTETAHFDLTVRAMRPKAVGDAPTTAYVDSQTYAFDEAVATSDAAGTERRIVFQTGDQGWARGYQIRFSNIRSCAIRSVTLTAQTEQRSGR